MLEVSQEISSHLGGGTSRAIVISEKDVDLRAASADNTLFILKIGEGSLAAGGRGGGFGERKVIAVLCYQLKKGSWVKMYEAEQEELGRFEVPYYVSRLPMTLADGTEAIGYGVVEPELVREMVRMAKIGSSP